MALRLELAPGRSAESWLARQRSHYSRQARQHVKLREITKVRLTAV